MFRRKCLACGAGLHRYDVEHQVHRDILAYSGYWHRADLDDFAVERAMASTQVRQPGAGANRESQETFDPSHLFVGRGVPDERLCSQLEGRYCSWGVVHFVSMSHGPQPLLGAILIAVSELPRVLSPGVAEAAICP